METKTEASFSSCWYQKWLTEKRITKTAKPINYACQGQNSVPRKKGENVLSNVYITSLTANQLASYLSIQ